MKELFRYDAIKYAPPLDEFENPVGEGRVDVKLRAYPVLKVTAKGAWIDNGSGSRFVLLTAKKRFACPTIQEAAESFDARKKAQLRILMSRMRDVEKALRIQKTVQPIRVETIWPMTM